MSQSNRSDMAKVDFGSLYIYRRPFGIGTSVWSLGSMEQKSYFPIYAYLTPYIRSASTRKNELLTMKAISNARTTTQENDFLWHIAPLPRKRKLSAMRAISLYAGSNAWATTKENHFFDTGIAFTNWVTPGFQARLRLGVMIRSSTEYVGYFLLGFGGTAALPGEEKSLSFGERDFLREENQRLRVKLNSVTEEHEQLHVKKRRKLPPGGETQYSYWQFLLDGSYDVALCSRYWADGVGSPIDLEVKRRLETVSKDLFFVHLCEHNSEYWEITELTPTAVENAHHQSVVIFGQIDQTPDGYIIEVRSYSKHGKYLSQPFSSVAKIREEISDKYYNLVSKAFPLVGEIANQSGNRVSIVLKGGRKLQSWEFAPVPQLVLINSPQQAFIEFVDYRDNMPRIIAKLDTDLSEVQSGVDVLVVGNLEIIEPPTLTLRDQYGNPCIDYQVFVSTQKDITDDDYVGLTSESGKINLKHKNTQHLYVLIKKYEVEIARFQIPRGADPNYKYQITIVSK